MKNLISILTIILFTNIVSAQMSIDVQAKGAANSTWILNKNISDKGASQDYAAAWGSSYGVAANAYFGMTGVGIEFLYSTHNAAYTGAYSINDISTGSYTSNVKLQTIQIPLMLKFQSEKGAYIELGRLLSNIVHIDSHSFLISPVKGS